MSSGNSTAREHSGGSPVRIFILQEFNDDDPDEPYWYDDDMPQGAEVSEEKCFAYVKWDMCKNPRHYAANKHRIVMREETEIPFPNSASDLSSSANEDQKTNPDVAADGD